MSKALEICRKRAAEAKSNRERMPQCAAYVAALEKHFGKVKVRYASENGIELGKPGPDGIGVDRCVVEKKRNGDD